MTLTRLRHPDGITSDKFAKRRKEDNAANPMMRDFGSSCGGYRRVELHRVPRKRAGR